mmetsp:Transcript_18685/g.45010  ORF Transcript_18685/g.45010 Transcript_18685/m.45010 type:complete len:516 (+) Transcript_18685:14-1561(+)
MPRKGCVRSSREIVTIQLGKAGTNIGHEFWRDLCVEHEINYQDDPLLQGIFTGPPDDPNHKQDHLQVFFNEGPSANRSSGQSRWVPRAILVDLNMQDLQQITADDLGNLYRPDNIIGNDEGAANCYAKAFHTEGPDLADAVLELVRREVEKCNCLQGVQFMHSVSGGTGSGLTGLTLKTLYDYLDRGSKCVLQSVSLVPCFTGASLLEPYNAALGLQDLLEYCDQCFCFDNDRLTSICQKTQDIAVPKYKDMNNIVAFCMSNITSSLRFPGALDSDLRKMHTNLVPFKNAHFLTTSFAPLTSATIKQYRNVNVKDLVQQMIHKDNVTVSCDTTNPGDMREGKTKARFLASFAAFRGSRHDLPTSSVDQELFELQHKRYDKFFPDWIPNCVATSLCDVPHADFPKASVAFTSNSTAIHEVFDRLIKMWEDMYKSKSFLHVFEQDGISTSDMVESRNVLQYVSDQYKELAKWPDKFFEEKAGPRSIAPGEDRSDEEMKIIEELLHLDDTYIKSSTTV